MYEKIITAAAVQQLAAYIPQDMGGSDAAVELAKLVDTFELERVRLSAQHMAELEAKLTEAFDRGVTEGQRQQIAQDSGAEPVNPIGMPFPRPWG